MPYFFACTSDTIASVVRFDIHHNVLFNYDVTGLRDRAVPSATGFGVTMCPADHLWFLLHRNYGEVGFSNRSRPAGRVFPPIAAVLQDPTIAWPRVVANARERNSPAACYYWLDFFRRLGVESIPSEVINELGSMNAGEREWGYQLAKLFDVRESFPLEFL